MRRVLRPNGWLCVSVNTSPASALLKLLASSSSSTGICLQRTSVEDQLSSSDGSEHNLLNLFKDAGFEHVETLTETRRLPFPLF